MSLKLEEIKSLIKEAKIEQHKMVYKALKGKMGNELHALSINTMVV